jgi:CRISPR system Cascade subunit CasE
MYLSRLTPNRRHTFDRPRGERPWDPYGLHQAVWSLFADGPDRRRDFLYRLDGDAGKVVVYTLSDRPPAGGSGFFRVEPKPLQPVLQEGDRLRFRLRANPVVASKALQKPDGKSRRVDLVMNERNRLMKEGIPKKDLPSREAIAQTVAKPWLRRKAEDLGFDVEEGEFGVLSYTYQKFAKSSGGKDAISLGLCDFEGVLTVRDPVRFVASLRQGIGPAKGFGCGLLLVRRAPGVE